MRVGLRLRRTALLALALACLSPGAAASDEGFLAAEVRLPEGGLLNGGLVAFQASGGPEAEVTTFFAQGRMTLETDQDTYSPGVSPVGGNPLQPPQASTHREELGPAHAFLVLPATGISGTYSLLVRPAPGSVVHASLRLQDVRLTVPGEAAFEHPKWVGAGPERPERHVAATGHHLDLDRELVLDITGDVVVALYDLDLTIADGQGTRTYRSGVVPHDGNVGTPAAGPAPPVSAGGYDDRELFLRIEDGSLSLRVDGSAITRLYVDVDEGATPGPVELAAAVPSGKASAPADRVRPGPAALELGAPRDGLLPVHVGPLTPRELEERLAATGPGPAGTVAAGPDPQAAWLAALALAAAALLLAAWALRLGRRRAAARMQLAFAAGRYDEAERLADRLLRHGSASEAALVQAVSLLRLGHADEAAALLGARRARRVDGATRDFLLACADAQRGRPAEAARHLARCLAAEPGYRAEALANPWLHGLVPRAAGGTGAAPQG